MSKGFSISVSGPAILAAASFAAGFIGNWVLIGAEHGSKADWMAAFGTWVIGASACALTIQAAKSQKKSERAIEKRQLRVMGVQARSLRKFAETFLGLNEDGAGEQQVRVVASAIEKRCKALKLDLAVVDTDDELERAVLQLEYNAYALQGLAAGFLEQPLSGHDIGASDCVPYKWMRQSAHQICLSADLVSQEIERKLTSFKSR